MWECHTQAIDDVDSSTFVFDFVQRKGSASMSLNTENSHRRSTAGLALGSGCATEALGS
jgi:hypothetical protein